MCRVPQQFATGCYNKCIHLVENRGVAQPGRAPGSGPGGRRFKSSLPDHLYSSHLKKIEEVPLRASFRLNSHCAQNCAHSACLGQKELRLRWGEHTAQTLPRNCVRRFVPASKHHTLIPRVLSGTCGASCKERKGALG